jgi:hypothetical protein
MTTLMGIIIGLIFILLFEYFDNTPKGGLT